MKFRIGDIIEITNNGHQYTTHIDMAIGLGADVSNIILDHFSQYGRTYKDLDCNLARKDRSCKWVYDGEVDNRVVCKILNIGSRDHYLVESVSDGMQFLMGKEGMKYIRKSNMFSDKDFEL